MRLGESAARTVVTVSALTLPRSLRERYREQWLADLRDAAEVGLNRGQIAVAALAFAATTSHPWPERRVLDPSQMQRRSRVAQGLALGAALLGLSQYASIVPSRDLTDGMNPGISLPAPGELLTGFLVVFAVFAPVLAVLIVGATKGIPPRVRLAVLLLAIASCAPVVQFAIDGSDPAWFDPYLSPGSIAYLVGGVLTVVAATMLYRTQPRPGCAPRFSRLRALFSGIIATGTVLAGGTIASAVWAHRRPVVWTDGTPAGPALRSNPYYLQWLTSWNRGEQAITSTFEWWIVAGVVLGALLAVFAIVSRVSTRSLALLVAGTVAAAVVATMGLLIFLQLAEGQTVDMEAVELVLVLARLGLVLVVATAGITTARAVSPGASSRARRASRRAALQ
jgi:hypothetical protein